MGVIAPLRSKISKVVLGLQAIVTGHNVHVQVSVDLPTILLILTRKSKGCHYLQELCNVVLSKKSIAANTFKQYIDINILLLHLF